MAHTRTIDGFEDGVANGSTAGVQASATRSGLYGWDCVTTSGGAALTRALSSAHPSVNTDGDHFDYCGRLFFRLQAYPSAADAIIATLRDPLRATGAGLDMLRLEMNTTGHVRLAAPVLFMTAARTNSYSSDPLTLNVWYGLELRIYGYVCPSAAGRMRGVLRIFDADTNETVWIDQTKTQFDVPLYPAYVRPNDATTVEIRQGAAESGISAGWQTLKTRIPSAVIVGWHYIGGSQPPGLGIGEYTTATSETTMTRAEANSSSILFSNQVDYYETGVLDPFNESISAFQQFTAGNGTIYLIAGHTNATLTHSRHVEYDDLFIDARSAADVDGLPSYPLETRIYGFFPTAQGVDNAFMPAGAYTRLTETPPGSDVAGQVVSSSTNGAATSYAHAPLADPVGTIAHVRAKLNGGSPGAKTHAIIIGTTDHPFTFTSTALQTWYADPVLAEPMASSAFATLAFGARNTFAGDAFRVNQLLLEALVFKNPPSVVRVTPKRGPVIGGTRVTIYGSGFLGVGISTPTVTIDSLPMTDVVVLDNYRIQATTPAHIVGWTAVTVNLGAQGGSGTLDHAFKYIDSFILNLRRQASDITIHDQLGDAPSSATFTVDTYGEVPIGKQEVLLYIAGDTILLFAGVVQTITEDFEEQHWALKWTCQATDYTDYLKRRFPYGHWEHTSVSTIVESLMRTYATEDFTFTGLQPALPEVTVTFNGEQSLTEVVTDLVTQMGGGGWFLDIKNLWFFQDIEFSDPPDALDAANTTLIRDPPFSQSEDWTQIRTRILMTGAGGNVAADVPIGGTQVPMDNVDAFNSAGGQAKARGQVFSYGAVQRGGHTLVGPGVGAPAPIVILRLGSGIESGVHGWSITFVTADGETMSGDRATANVGYTIPPLTAPIGGRVAGTGLNIGRYQYAFTYQTSAGETTPSPLTTSYDFAGNIITGVDTQGGIAGPGGTVFVPPPPPPQSLIDRMVATYGASSNWNALRPANVASASTPLLHDMAVQYGTMADDPPPNWNALRPLSGGTLIPSTGMNPPPAIAWYNDSPYTMSGNLPGAIGGGFTILDNIIPGDNVNLTYSYSDGNGTAPDLTSSSTAVANLFGMTTSGWHGTFHGRYSDDPRCTLILLWASRNSDAYRRMWSSIGNAQPGTALYESTQNKKRGEWRWQGSLARLTSLLSNAPATQLQAVGLTFPATINPDVTAIKLYRSQVNQTQLKLAATLSPSTTSYTDTLADGSLGANAPTTNTSTGANKADLIIKTGPSPATTARKIYRTAANDTDLRILQTVADNTTTTVADSAGDATLGSGTPPFGDTSGLPIVTGQVAQGSTSMIVANIAIFNVDGGVFYIGDMRIKYSGVSGNKVIGIPVDGPGSIGTAIPYGATIIVQPTLLNVSGLTIPLQMNTGAARSADR